MPIGLFDTQPPFSAITRYYLQDELETLFFCRDHRVTTAGDVGILSIPWIFIKVGCLVTLIR